MARHSRNLIYRVQKGGIYAGRENFKKHNLPRAEGGMYADRANITQSSEVLRELNASQETLNRTHCSRMSTRITRFQVTFPEVLRGGHRLEES
jgi:hypothetical protein